MKRKFPLLRPHFAMFPDTSKWDYRVLKRKIPLSSNEIEENYAIYEVYYDSKGKVESCTKDPVHPHGLTLEELKREIWYYGDALKQPVLEYDDIGGPDDELINMGS